MQGCIKFTNGKILWFNDNNLHEVIEGLTEKQRDQVIEILKGRMGPKPANEFGVDEDVHTAWHESVHRKDIILGGGSKNGESNINKKGTKKLVRNWKDKGEGERNITWLMNVGFRRRWGKDVGYVYKRDDYAIPHEWLQDLDHEMFKHKVKEMMVNEPTW